MPTVADDSAVQRLRTAAFDLFAQQGYDVTTVDHIAERAGVGRSTFFRTFRAKEDVIFPDHEAVLARLRERFDAAGTEHTLVAVTEAAGMVLRSYLAEGERARERYALTRAVPVLRSREIASMQQYQRAFREFIRTWIGDDLRAELMAGAVVTAHNRVLRGWLRGTTPTGRAEAELERAMAAVLLLFSAAPAVVHAGPTVVVHVLGEVADPDAVADRVRADVVAQLRDPA